MPYLSITTNRSPDQQARDELLRSVSAAVAEALGKPEQYVMVSLQSNPDMLFAGSNEPLAYLELKSIGLPDSATPELSAAISKLLATRLEIEQSRIYIEFANAPRHMWGWNGGTF